MPPPPPPPPRATGPPRAPPPPAGPRGGPTQSSPRGPPPTGPQRATAPSGASKSSGAAPKDRGALLNQIQGGAKLRKVKESDKNDRSKPILDDIKPGNIAISAPTNAITPKTNSTPGQPNPLKTSVKHPQVGPPAVPQPNKPATNAYTTMGKKSPPISAPPPVPTISNSKTLPRQSANGPALPKDFFNNSIKPGPPPTSSSSRSSQAPPPPPPIEKKANGPPLPPPTSSRQSAAPPPPPPATLKNGMGKSASFNSPGKSLSAANQRFPGPPLQFRN